MQEVSNCVFLVPFHSVAPLCRGACVEVESDTEAVASKGFKLGCISCKMRAEVPAVTTVDWFYRATNDAEFSDVSSDQM